MLEQGGIRCDVCGNYILMQTAASFELGGIVGTLTAHTRPDCIGQMKACAEANDITLLPDGPIRRCYEKRVAEEAATDGRGRWRVSTDAIKCECGDRAEHHSPRLDVGCMLCPCVKCDAEVYGDNIAALRSRVEQLEAAIRDAIAHAEKHGPCGHIPQLLEPALRDEVSR